MALDLFCLWLELRALTSDPDSALLIILCDLMLYYRLTLGYFKVLLMLEWILNE